MRGRCAGLASGDAPGWPRGGGGPAISRRGGHVPPLLAALRSLVFVLNSSSRRLGAAAPKTHVLGPPHRQQYKEGEVTRTRALTS